MLREAMGLNRVLSYAALLALSLPLACVDRPNGDSVEGVYAVSSQTGSAAAGRPACLDDSLLISDLVAVSPDLQWFQLALVGGTPENEAQDYGFVECASSSDCSEDYLLGSPAVDTLTGGFETVAFGFVEGGSTGECLRIRMSSRLEPQSAAGLVRMELLNEIVFVSGNPALTLEEQEAACLSNPPAIPPDTSCRREEIIEGARP